MPQPLKPSPFNTLFQVADLLRANVSFAELGRQILSRDPSQPLDVTTLLAAILKNQQRPNGNFVPVAFTLAAFQQVQIYPGNPVRNYFILQNAGLGDLFMLAEPGPVPFKDFSTNAGTQAYLTQASARAFRIVAGGSYEPNPIPPNNPITIFTLATGTNGLACEAQ